MNKTAILIGATGLTGSHLLDFLLTSKDYDKVKVFTRKTTHRKHPKLEEIVGDILLLDNYTQEFIADEVFCCIGTTKAKTPDKKLYHAIDYGIPVTAAKLCQQNKISTFSAISALGANKNSSIFYNRTKGEMEESISQYNIPNILIYRPSFIYGKRSDKRLTEKIGIAITTILQPLLIGNLKKYKAIEGKDLARAMYNGAQKPNGLQIITRAGFDLK